MIDVLWDVARYGVFPVALAALAGFLFWRKGRVLLGNAIGSGIIAAIMVLFILARFGAFMANPIPGQEPINAMLLLAVVGWVDVFALFVISGVAEDRARIRQPIQPDDF